MNKDQLRTELTRDEAEKLMPYTDTVGKLTIGVGRNLSDRGISHDESQYLLSNDIRLVESDLNQNLPWWINLTDARQRVLANMCFNLGINRLLGFKNTLEFIRTEQWGKAADGMLQSTWAKQVGQRAVRLSEMMRNG
jgi:lysozyme